METKKIKRGRPKPEHKKQTPKRQKVKVKKKTGPKWKVTIAKFKKALPGTGGIVSQIARKCNVSRITMCSFIERTDGLGS